MINGVNITSEDILEIQRHLKGYLVNKVPEADLTDGSFLNDVVIRSMAYVVALFERESANIKSRVSLNDVSTSEDSTAAQVLDNLASNYFISRNEGNFSSGIVRVVVSTNTRGVTIQPHTRFTKTSGVNFMYAGGIDGETTLVVGTQSLLAEVGTDSEETGNYYFDVAVVGEVEFLGSELAPGEFESVSPSIANLVSIRNYTPFSIADSMETNSAFAERIKSSITNRGMSSVFGIKTHILDTVNAVNKVVPIPSSSAYMRRDLLDIGGTTTNFKTLGKCNLYTSSGTQEKSVTVLWEAANHPAEGPDDLLTLEVPRGEVANLLAVTAITGFGNRVDKFFDSTGVHTLTLLNNSLVPDNPEEYVAPTEHLEFVYLDSDEANLPSATGSLFARTNKERLAVRINFTANNVSLPITHITSLVPELVETEVAKEDNVIPGLDTLCYSFSLKRLFLDIKYFKSLDAPGSVPEAFLATDLSSYLTKLASQNVNISLAEVYSYVLEEYSSYISGIDFSESSAEMSVFLPNGNTVVYTVGTSTSFSSPSTSEYYTASAASQITIKQRDYLPEGYLEDLQVGDETCLVYIDRKDITFTEVTV
jgi:hypothetical protein